MRLSEGKKGNRYKVNKIGLDAAVVRRLYTLGMTEGTQISVLNSKKLGPMIINIRGTRFALGKNFCDEILVEEEVL